MLTNSDELKRTIGKRIKTLMKKNGTTADQLSEALDKGIETVKRYRSGVIMTPCNVLCDIANYFKCDVEYILGQQDEETKTLQSLHATTGMSSKSCNALFIRKDKYNGSLDWMISNGLFDILDSLDISVDNQRALFQHFKKLPLAVQEQILNTVNKKKSNKYYTLPESNFLSRSSAAIAYWVYHLTEKEAKKYLADMKDLLFEEHSDNKFIPYVSALNDLLSDLISESPAPDNLLDNYRASSRFSKDEELYNICEPIAQSYYHTMEQYKIDMYFASNDFTTLAKAYVEGNLNNKIE